MPARFYSLLSLLAILASPLSAAPPPKPGQSKPNLVFIIADDCTYLDMEVYGGQARTPTLNKLAEEDRKSVV